MLALLVILINSSAISPDSSFTPTLERDTSASSQAPLSIGWQELAPTFTARIRILNRFLSGSSVSSDTNKLGEYLLSSLAGRFRDGVDDCDKDDDGSSCESGGVDDRSVDAWYFLDSNIRGRFNLDNSSMVNGTDRSTSGSVDHL